MSLVHFGELHAIVLVCDDFFCISSHVEQGFAQMILVVNLDGNWF